MKKNIVVGTTAVTGLLASQVSMAAIDVTAAMAEIDGLPALIATIGGALLLAAGTAVAYKWAKASFFS